MKLACFLTAALLLAGVCGAADRVTFTSPTAGQAWIKGTVQTVSFTLSVDTVYCMFVNLYKDGSRIDCIRTYCAPVIYPAGSYSFSWTVGKLMQVTGQEEWAAPGCGYTLQVESEVGAQYGESGVFTIGPLDDSTASLPAPVIRFSRVDSAGRVYIPVRNWAAYPNEMFRAAPELPPCGLNPNASRTWVGIYDALTDAWIYGFCALTSNDGLKHIWFSHTPRRGRVYIILEDRSCGKRYRSNTVAWRR